MFVPGSSRYRRSHASGIEISVSQSPRRVISLLGLTVTLLITSLLFASPSLAQVDGELAARLDGMWLIDVEATEQRVRAHPEFDQMMEGMLPMILENMTRMSYTFGDGELLLNLHGQQQNLPIAVTKARDDRIWLSTEFQGETAYLEIEFQPGDRFVMHSSGTDDMASFVWRRAKEGEQAAPPPTDPGQQAQQRMEEVRRAMEEAEGGY